LHPFRRHFAIQGKGEATDVEQALAPLALLVDGGRLLVQLGKGQLVG
jgi:hypothetical protein